jgi:hypothetical protein
MPAPGQAAKLLIAVGVCAGLSACGSGIRSDATVLEVGHLAISKATVEHWTKVIERGGAFSGFRGAPRRGTAVQRAVTLLVTSHMLIDEAARQSVAAPRATIQQALSEREQSAEFNERLQTTGETIPDVELEMRAELAGEAIREKLAGEAAAFTRAELVDFYQSHPSMFSGLEVRVTDLIEDQPSASAAAALVRRIGTGARFASLAIREQVSRTPGYMATPEKTKVVDAIFAARPGVVSHPMRLNKSWAIFIVRRAIPPMPKPLGEVRSEVARSLDVSRQHEIASRFDSAYVARMRADTRCTSGYVAAGCPQFKGLLEAYEDPFSRRAHPLLSEAAVPD